MSLFIGKEFKFISKGIVSKAKIVGIDGEFVIVLLDGKTKIKLYKEKLKNKFSDNEIEKNMISKRKCENCMEYKKGNCCGESQICNDFRLAPEISQEELDRWPKYGSVSSSKSDRTIIREYDDMYNKYN